MGTGRVTFLPRLLTQPLEQALTAFPVVVVTGARQTGKTTLVRRLGGDRTYLTLDDLDVRDQALSAPDDLLRRGEHLTLDEVQRSPDLLLAVKRAVDRDRRPGRFLLTGSANLLLSQRIAETLAGRATYSTLWPMTWGELSGGGRAGRWTSLFSRPPRDWPGLLAEPKRPPTDWKPLAVHGGYPTPAAALKTAEQRTLWFAGYTQTYLERDLRDLARIESLVEFRRLMRAACLRLGNLLNQTELARDTGIPRATVQRYLDLLEVSYQLLRLEPYSVNRTKRLIKSPKLYWTDTGLSLYLGDEESPTGAHFENLILCDLLAWRDAEPARPSVLYWRTAGGEEVDIVVERRGKLLAVEAKATPRPTHRDARHLRSFLDEYEGAAHGALLLHAGATTEWLSEDVLSAPWWRIL
jgi:predicted AAA+ superfamily ATPase